MTTKISSGLYMWALTLATGETRQVLASSLQSAIGHLPVISAERGAAVETATPPPVLTQLAPATAALGSPNFTLQVIGTGFQPSDVILWNGAPEPTTVVSDTELTTLVNMASAQAEVTLPVSVQTAIGGVSNSLEFTLTAAVEGLAGRAGR